MTDLDKQKEIFENAEMFKNYFAEDELALNNLLEKLNSLQGISDGQIEAMINANPGRGVQHNLVEHMINSISIASQVQAVLKDKRSIKEKSLDLALKNSKDEAESSDMEEVIANMQKLIKDSKTKINNKVEKLETKVEEANQPTDEELDQEIAKKLGF